MKNLFILAASSLLTLSVTIGTVQAADHGWSYTGKNGPDHWASLDKNFASCAHSKSQSPIDIRSSDSQTLPLPVLGFAYQGSGAEIVNNGHTVQVNLQPGSSLTVDGVKAELLQFHFHAPSEERFDGKSYPMDAHLVHKTADGKLSVVAILFEEGKENPALASVLSALPAAGKSRDLAAFNPATLLPSDHSYYRFTGSLTTPPCSDGVSWQVLKQTVELSKAQIDAFTALYPMNARPVQPLNDRVIEVSQ